MIPSLRKRLDQLDAKLAGLANNLQKYSFEQLSTAPAPGAWSVIQVLQHMMVAEKSSLQYVMKKSSYPDKLTKAGFTSHFRKIALTFFLYAPFKFKAPAVVAEEKFAPVSSLEEAMNEWRSIRNDLRVFLEKLPEGISQLEVYRHPFAGRMDAVGMLRFLDGHFARHQKQIERTLREVV